MSDMPVQKKSKPVFVSRGAGMIAGLELWNVGGRIVMYDASTDGRYADDIRTWNAGLNAATLKQLKDAASKNTAPTSATNSSL
jgi:hypothetical protein